MTAPTLHDDLETLRFHFDCLGSNYADDDHDDHELRDVIQAGVRLTSAIKRMEHVAWCRYSRNTIVTCDSDADGAFKVYRHPLGLDEREVKTDAGPDV